MDKVAIVRNADVNVQRMDWGTLTWYVSKELGTSEELTVGRCVIKPGCENPKHFHPNCDEVLHVLKGKIIHTAEGMDDVEMNPGDTISIPPEVKHNAKNIGSEEADLFICFSEPDRKTIVE